MNLHNAPLNTPDTHYRRDSPSQSCPDCDGCIVQTSNEHYCANCGLVLSEPLSHTKWTRSRSRGVDTVTQTGFSRTPTLHDKGLATVIGTPTDNQRTSQSDWTRLQRENRRSHASSRHTRNLRYALGELKRQTTALNLSHSTLEQTAKLYHQLANDDLINGRNIDALTSGSIYAVTRLNDFPIIPADITPISRASRNEFLSAYRTILEKQSLPIPPAHPRTFLNRVASAVSASTETTRRCSQLLTTIAQNTAISGHRPIVITAAVLYSVTHDQSNIAVSSDTTFTQQDIANAAHARRKTIRKATRVIKNITNNPSDTPTRSSQHAT